MAHPPLGELESHLDGWMAELGLSARHRYFQTEVGRVHVLEAGQGEDAVLLAPGLAASAGEYGRLIKRLATRHRVLAIDRPGTGLSDPIGFSGHPREVWVRAMATVADQLGLESFILVGHSVGGLAAGAFATAYPERVRRLVLLSPLGLERRTPLRWNVLLLPGAADLLVAADRARRIRMLRRRPERVRGGGRLAPWPSPMEAYRRGVALRFGPGSELALLARLARPLILHPESLLLPGLERVADRTMVVWGSCDRQLPLANARSALRLHPELRLVVVAGEGHTLPFAKPGVVAALVASG
ncbi:MAG: alpha/beta fold hydrolase [Candidatus Dormibacteria bacterium]